MLTALADAVVTELNAKSWATDINTAIRRNTVEQDIENLTALECLVRAVSLKREREARGNYYKKTATVGIGLRQRITVLKGAATNDATDPLVALGEQIADHFGQFVATVSAEDYAVDESDLTLPYDHESIIERGLFVGVITLTFSWLEEGAVQ